MEKDYKFHAEILEYGPGLYVSYFQKEGRLNEIEEISELRKNLEAMKFHGKIILEMGRYLAASCGYYLTKIVDKKINNYQEYAIVDGGTHQMNYFGQTMAMKLPYFVQLNGKTLLERNFDEESHREVTVCGALCTVSDVLVKNMPLYGEYLGDIIVFENVGAYSVTEGISLFLSRSLPKIVMWSEKEGLKLKRDIVESSLFNSGDSKIKSYS